MAKDQSLMVPGPLKRGGYVVRFSQSEDDVRAVQRLRHACFVEAAGRPAAPDGLDRDSFDMSCDHVLVEDATGRVLCSYRVQIFQTVEDLGESYSAQYYALDGLAGRAGSFLELGRFCVADDATDADILRLAWGMLARIVDLRNVSMMFGCSSFAGCDAGVYAQAFNLLAARHVSPLVAVKAAEVVQYAEFAGQVGDRAMAMGQVPTLLRTYLSMGGWVSDHAVIDREMNTLHVFTGLEIAAIPEARARALRAVAGG